MSSKKRSTRSSSKQKYDDAHLRMNIAHDVNDILNAGDKDSDIQNTVEDGMVFVLKDTEVLNDSRIRKSEDEDGRINLYDLDDENEISEDQLVNLDLLENEKAAARKRETEKVSRHKRVGAAGGSYMFFDEENEETDSILLSNDTESIQTGKSRTTLGSLIAGSRKIVPRSSADIKTENLDLNEEDMKLLPIDEHTIGSKSSSADYYTAEEASSMFKKKKKKRNKNKRLTSSISEDDLPAESIFNNKNGSKRKIDELEDEKIDFVDDEDLQIALASSRKRVIKAKKSSTDIKAIADDILRDTNQHENDTNIEDKSLVFTEIQEFAKNLSPIVREDAKEESQEEVDFNSTSRRETSQSIETNESRMEGVTEDLTSISGSFHDEKKDYDDSMHQIMEEPLVNQGLASTLSLLRNQGALKAKADAHIGNSFKDLEEKEKFDEEILKRERLKYLRSLKKHTAVDQSSEDFTDEQYFKAREKLLSDKNYKPHVNIEYKDEFGRVLSKKEAWKELCHRFHGIKSGKRKTEKRLKKIKEDLLNSEN